MERIARGVATLRCTIPCSFSAPARSGRNSRDDLKLFLA